MCLRSRKAISKCDFALGQSCVEWLMLQEEDVKDTAECSKRLFAKKKKKVLILTFWGTTQNQSLLSELIWRSKFILGLEK